MSTLPGLMLFLSDNKDSFSYMKAPQRSKEITLLWSRLSQAEKNEYHNRAAAAKSNANKSYWKIDPNRNEFQQFMSTRIKDIVVTNKILTKNSSSTQSITGKRWSLPSLMPRLMLDTGETWELKTTPTIVPSSITHKDEAACARRVVPCINDVELLRVITASKLIESSQSIPFSSQNFGNNLRHKELIVKQNAERLVRITGLKRFLSLSDSDPEQVLKKYEQDVLDKKRMEREEKQKELEREIELQQSRAARIEELNEFRRQLVKVKRSKKPYYLGVSFDNGRPCAFARNRSGDRIKVGAFSTQVEAAHAYDSFIRQEYLTGQHPIRNFTTNFDEQGNRVDLSKVKVVCPKSKGIKSMKKSISKRKKRIASVRKMKKENKILQEQQKALANDGTIVRRHG